MGLLLITYLCSMKTILHIFFLTCLSYSGTAQLAGNTDFNIWYAQPGDTFFVYGNTANIRQQPDLTATVQDSVICGTALIIKEQTKNLDQVKGIAAPWARIQYTIQGQNKEGFIWLGMLALGHYSKNETRFLYGIEKIVTTTSSEDDYFLPPSWFLRIKAIDTDNQLLDEKEWKMEGPETSVSSGKLLGDMGLKNIKEIVRINLGGEACGVPTYYYYYGWNGKKLLPLPGKMEVGDAGVFYHTETFIFPKEEGGQPDKIIRLTEESEAGDKVDKKGEPIFKSTKTRETYIWNGDKAVKTK